MITIADKRCYASLFEDKLWVHVFARIGYVTEVQIGQVLHTFLFVSGEGALCGCDLVMKVSTTHRVDYKVPISQSLVYLAIMRLRVNATVQAFLTLGFDAVCCGGHLDVRSELGG